MSHRYAMIGAVSNEPLSYGGLILVHDDRAEMEFLFQGVAKVVELGDQFPAHDCMPIRQHPELASMTWPLNRGDFA